MADEKKDETATKDKHTVPALTRTARGIADHAAAVLEMQWDKEKRAFKDPFTAMLALFTYAKLTPALLDELEKKLDARATAAEIRIEKLEQQIAAFESWRAEVMAQSDEAQKKLEELMAGGDPVAMLKQAMDTRSAPAVAAAAAPPPLPAIIDTPIEQAASVADVVPLKPEKTDKKSTKPVEKNGGAA